MGNGIIFTVGHSTVSVEFFLELLRKNSINCVVDVRSVPSSRHAPQFNQSELKRFLSGHDVLYIPMGEEFGARRDDSSLYTDGYLDFEKTERSGLFLRGIDRVKQGLKKAMVMAIMCTEKDPLECHRFSLVSRALCKQGMDVRHILHDEGVVLHCELEKRLVISYFPEKFATVEQTTLDFGQEDSGDISYEQLLCLAYRKKNAEIGFKYIQKREAVSY